MAKSEGLVGLVAEERTPIKVEDALTHPRFKFFPETGEEKYHSFLGVPIGHGLGMLGVLVLQSRRRRRFSEQDVSLLRSVAGQVRGVMLNAHLSERLQREEESRDRYRRDMAKAIERVKAFEVTEARRLGPKAPEDMVRFSGLGAAPGFGLGFVHRVEPPADLDGVSIAAGAGVEHETKRFDEALAESVKEVEISRTHMRELVPEVGGALFEALRMMIEDPGIRRGVDAELAKEVTAESALKIVIGEYLDRFSGLEDEYLRERAVDIRDAGQRILRHLLGLDERRLDLGEDTVLVGEELTLSDLATVDHTKLRGIVTSSGGVTSHAAILAKSLGIPTVVGADGVDVAANEQDRIVVDGNTGTVHLRPGPELLVEYERLEYEYSAFQRELEEMRGLPAETTDGNRVALLANIGLVGELALAERYGAEGIGLYRTEFQFISYRDFPSEEEQYRLYTRVLDRMAGKPVTIRTLDLGADKYPVFASAPRESNPFLGFRSIRVSLEIQNIFVEQLRAVLRAAGSAPLRVMFPMVTSVEELRSAKEIYAQCLADLAAEGVALPQAIELGAMIEVPAAVFRAEPIMREVDFVSIGTNDLIQYTLAVDRDNRRVASMYEPLHPAVLQSIATVVEAGRKTGRRVAMCGEMAGNPLCTVLLVGMGLEELSMSSVYIPVVRKIIRAVSYEDAVSIANNALRLDTVEEVKGYLFSSMKELGVLELAEAFS
jgi:phosphotransferase system enzyme I (PtsP)